ncbi:MAG: protein translocase subunit SecF [Clostridiales bacterium]|nr:protein translocase subunit SecF [Clostridiales bacterium]
MDIIANKKRWFGVSAVIMLVGLLFALINGVNYGIDFTGGSLIEIELGRTITSEEARLITDDFDTAANIKFIGDEKTILQIRSIEDFDSERRVEIFNLFRDKYSLEENDFLRVEKIGPAIGTEIRNRAFLAIIISTIGMLIYITFRFEIYYGIAAIVALLHDVAILLAVYSILGMPINSPFVAAILTILGYSINDTIVVFDRVRENMRSIKKYNYAEVANKSISQTITRSINTSLTTLLTIVALYIIGVEQIREFALPLIAGILCGTYSSIFIASPVWVVLKERKRRKIGYNPNVGTK